MSKGRRRSTVETLGRWPLLIAAVVCIGAGMSFDVAANDTEETRAYLLALGAVLLGAWVALLAAHDYRGAEPDDTPDE
jgi:hypothetical protein